MSQRQVAMLKIYIYIKALKRANDLKIKKMLHQPSTMIKNLIFVRNLNIRNESHGK